MARNDPAAAHFHIQKCIDVTPQMAFQLIAQLRAMGVEYVVAPYEADAQMAWLSRSNKVAAIITEDSDLLLFGCSRVLYKLDSQGYAEEICLERLGECEELDLSNFTLAKVGRGMGVATNSQHLINVYGDARLVSSHVHAFGVRLSTLDPRDGPKDGLQVPVQVC